jgi:hypothetical protein
MRWNKVIKKSTTHFHYDFSLKKCYFYYDFSFKKLNVHNQNLLNHVRQTIVFLAE